MAEKTQGVLTLNSFRTEMSKEDAAPGNGRATSCVAATVKPNTLEMAVETSGDALNASTTGSEYDYDTDDSTEGHEAGCACVGCWDDPQDYVLNERTQTYVNPNHGSDFEMVSDGDDYSHWVLKARKKDKVSVQFQIYNWNTGKPIDYEFRSGVVKKVGKKKNDCFLVQFEKEKKWIELSPNLQGETWKFIFNFAKTI